MLYVYPMLITNVGVWQQSCNGFLKRMMTFNGVDCMCSSLFLLVNAFHLLPAYGIEFCA
jgi:hypothetical protein